MKTHRVLSLVLGEWNSAGHLLWCTAPHNLQTENKYHHFQRSWWLKQMCLHFILHYIVKKKGDSKKSENKNRNIMKF
jgi:hypothetical protein